MSEEIDSNELQSESNQETDYLDNSADLEQQQGDDSETSSEPQHEQNSADVENNSVNQEAVNNAISKQHAKYREEQRRRQAVEQELQQLRQSGQHSDPEPEIFKIDPYADDVEDQIKRRDESLRAHVNWQQRQEYQRNQATQYEQARQVEQQQAAQQQAERFFNSAAELKVDQNELNHSIQTIGQYQLGQEVASYIMGDDKGVQMTQALAKNPTLLAELSIMSPHQAILHIERNVRSKLNPMPRASQGKKPPTRVKGRASDVSDRFPLTGGKITVE